MAKQYNLKIELGAESTLQDEIAKLEEIVKLKKQIDGKLNMTSDLDPKTLQDIIIQLEKLTKAYEAQKKVVEEKTAADKEAEKISKQLTASTDDEVKARIRFQRATQDQKKILSDLLTLEDREAGTIERLAAANRRLVAERNKLNLSTAEGRARLQQINTELDKNNKVIKESNDQLGQQKINIGNYKSALEGLPGVLGQASQGVSGLGQQFLALLANPIVAIIAAITGGLMAMYKAFMKTDEGATLMGGAMRGIGSVLDIISGLLLKVGKFMISAFEDPKQAIIDLGNLIKDNILNRFRAFGVMGEAITKLFKGDFKEGLKGMADGMIQVGTGITNATDKMKGFVSEVVKATKEAIALEKAFDDLADREREFSTQIKRNERDIARLLVQAKDKTKTDAERMALLNKANALEEQNYQIQLALAKEKVKLIQRENAEAIKNRKLKEVNASLSDEEAQKEVDATNAVIDLEKEHYVLQEKIANRVNGFKEEIHQNELNRIAEEDKAKQKAFDDDQKRKKQEEDSLKKTMGRERAANKTISEDAEKLTKSLKSTKDRETAANEKIAADEAKKKKEQFDEQVRTANVVANALNEGFEKQSQEKMAALEREDKAQEQNLEMQRSRAERGLDNTLELEQRKAAELEIEKEKQRKKDEWRQRVMTYWNLVSSYAKDPNTRPDQAALRAAKDIVIAEGITAAFAAKGGIVGEVAETTTLSSGSLSRSHGIGKDVLTVMDPREGILNVNEMNALGRDGFYNLKYMLNNPMHDNIMFEKVPVFAPVVAQNNNKELVKEMRAIKESIKNIPVTNYQIDNFGQMVKSYVDAQGNKETRTFQNPGLPIKRGGFRRG